MRKEDGRQFIHRLWMEGNSSTDFWMEGNSSTDFGLANHLQQVHFGWVFKKTPF
jgi:hypothetical protein